MRALKMRRTPARDGFVGEPLVSLHSDREASEQESCVRAAESVCETAVRSGFLLAASEAEDREQFIHHLKFLIGQNLTNNCTHT